MKRIVVVLMWLTFGSAPAWAFPTQITFQGTLKQSGVPVNGTKNMQFSFVDGSGSSIPGTTPISMANVQVTNGLFAVQLPIDPTVNWQSYTPFIQVSVAGEILNPNQPMTSNLYSIVADSVVDGAITTAKIAAGAVTMTQIANGAVTSAQVANNAIGTLQLSNGAVTTAQLAQAAVTSTTVANGAIGNAQLAEGAITTDKLDAGVLPSFIPPGTIVAYAGATAPTGWFLCQGETESRTTYSALFQALGSGTIWGAGDGSSNFNVPDLQGRAPIGAGSGAALTPRTLGTTLGNETHRLTVAEMPSHTHPAPDGQAFDVTGSDSNRGIPFSSDAVFNSSFANTGATGGDQPHDIMNPSAVVNYIIKY